MEIIASMSIDELLDEIVLVTNNISNPSESNYLMNLREEVEKRFRFANEKIFRLGNIAHSSISILAPFAPESKVLTTRAWVNNILYAKKFD